MIIIFLLSDCVKEEVQVTYKRVLIKRRRTCIGFVGERRVAWTDAVTRDDVQQGHVTACHTRVS